MRADYFESNDTGRLKLFQSLRLDPPLTMALLLLTACGLGILYSAGSQNIDLIFRQLTRLSLAFGVMVLMAQIPPQNFRLWAPWIFLLGIVLLTSVLVFGDVGKGAKRWLDFGVVRFQPSEMMKLAAPMMVAWFLADKPLPPSFKHLAVALILVIMPTMLIAKQPDLGTSLLIAAAGFFVIYFAGLKWRVLAGFAVLVAAMTPLVWHYMHDYQRRRVLTFLNPENDPLGSGYHIIQSKIAIGSGGLYGKGWLNGTQSHLDFLPERSTDFIFAVFAEEFGFIGVIVLLALYVFIVIRGLVIASQAQDSFGRLLAGSLSLTFLVYLFVNVGMVSGLLPVVGVPLPLVSYGGTSMVTLMAGFGMLMSIQSHRRLLRQ
ncbi:MAG: rod shape-determining protein RodA [Gammaproteobacteria bacterium]|nr:rod shape-determining protein RodA [Gammaproteobacteria bacterium]